MNKVNIAAFLMALLVVGAVAAPRKVLETTDANLPCLVKSYA